MLESSPALVEAVIKAGEAHTLATAIVEVPACKYSLINKAKIIMLGDAHDSAVMYGGFQGGPQLGPHDAERRQSLGQLHV